jgi:hypothetical protein
MRTAVRKDANHKEIENAFKKMGFSVLDISQLKNCCDLFVSKRCVTYAVEIKDGTKTPSQRKLTSGEREFKETWELNGRWRLIESIEDVERLNNDIVCR